MSIIRKRPTSRGSRGASTPLERWTDVTALTQARSCCGAKGRVCLWPTCMHTREYLEENDMEKEQHAEVHAQAEEHGAARPRAWALIGSDGPGGPSRRKPTGICRHKHEHCWLTGHKTPKTEAAQSSKLSALSYFIIKLSPWYFLPLNSTTQINSCLPKMRCEQGAPSLTR